MPLAPLTVPLFSTDDNARFGTVTWDAEHGTRVAVTLDDGRKLDWELVGEVLEPASTWVTPSPGWCRRSTGAGAESCCGGGL